MPNKRMRTCPTLPATGGASAALNAALAASLLLVGLLLSRAGPLIQVGVTSLVLASAIALSSYSALLPDFFKKDSEKISPGRESSIISASSLSASSTATSVFEDSGISKSSPNSSKGKSVPGSFREEGCLRLSTGVGQVGNSDIKSSCATQVAKSAAYGSFTDSWSQYQPDSASPQLPTAEVGTCASQPGVGDAVARPLLSSVTVATSALPRVPEDGCVTGEDANSPPSDEATDDASDCQFTEIGGWERQSHPVGSDCIAETKRLNTLSLPSFKLGESLDESSAAQRVYGGAPSFCGSAVHSVTHDSVLSFQLSSSIRGNGMDQYSLEKAAKGEGGKSAMSKMKNLLKKPFQTTLSVKPSKVMLSNKDGDRRPMSFGKANKVLPTPVMYAMVHPKQPRAVDSPAAPIACEAGMESSVEGAAGLAPTSQDLMHPASELTATGPAPELLMKGPEGAMDAEGGAALDQGLLDQDETTVWSKPHADKLGPFGELKQSYSTLQNRRLESGVAPMMIRLPECYDTEMITTAQGTPYLDCQTLRRAVMADSPHELSAAAACEEEDEGNINYEAYMDAAAAYLKALDAPESIPMGPLGCTTPFGDGPSLLAAGCYPALGDGHGHDGLGYPLTAEDHRLAAMQSPVPPQAHGMQHMTYDILGSAESIDSLLGMAAAVVAGDVDLIQVDSVVSTPRAGLKHAAGDGDMMQQTTGVKPKLPLPNLQVIDGVNWSLDPQPDGGLPSNRAPESVGNPRYGQWSGTPLPDQPLPRWSPALSPGSKPPLQGGHRLGLRSSADTRGAGVMYSPHGGQGAQAASQAAYGKNKKKKKHGTVVDAAPASAPSRHALAAAAAYASLGLGST